MRLSFLNDMLLLTWLLCSWTVITWIAVVGSMLIMCLWVTVYSFFHTISFNNEVIILFGTVGFWTTVVITIMLAIGEYLACKFRNRSDDIGTGPRFVMKFVSQAYFPLDREIVREAWVAGDLKERLGVEHRRAKKHGDPEGAFLFRPHVRGASDDDQGEYEPVVPHSAPRSPAPSRPAPLALQVQEGMTQHASDMASRYHDVNYTPPSAAYSSSGGSQASPSLGIQQVPLSARSLTPAMAEQQGRHHYTNRSRSPTEYEMTNRSESALNNHAPERNIASRASRITDASFVTASDGGWDQEDDGATVRQPPENRSSYYPGQAGQAI